MTYRHHTFRCGAYTLLASRLPRASGMRGLSLYSLHHTDEAGRPTVKFWHYPLPKAKEVILQMRIIDAILRAKAPMREKVAA